MTELPASRQLLNITKAALDHCEAECERLQAALGNKYREGYDNALAEQHVEIERLRAALKDKDRKGRNFVIEECAKVALDFSPNAITPHSVAAAIRALKDRP